MAGLLKNFLKYSSTWHTHLGFQILFHIVAALGIVYSSWHWLWLSLIGVILFRHIGGEIGAHRYYAHRSFEAKPWAQKLMIICGLFLYQGSPYSFIPIHRLHHQKSDTIDDPHSPHFLNFVNVYFPSANQYYREPVDKSYFADLIKDPVLQFLHRNYLIIVTIPLIITALIDWRIPVFLFAIPVVITFHSAGLGNTIGHLYGYRNFETTDKSQNSTWVNILTLGSGLHNNHHAYPERYNYKMTNKWYERDDINVFLIEKLLMEKK